MPTPRLEFRYEIDPQRPSFVVSGRVLQGRISSAVYIVDALWTDNHFLPTHELVEGQTRIRSFAARGEEGLRPGAD